MDKKVFLSALSNPLGIDSKEAIYNLENLLCNNGIETVRSKYLFDIRNGLSNFKEKAEELNKTYSDESIDDIFDVSGGDLANGLIEYLDYGLIEKSAKRMFGYSDLTCVLNGIVKKTENKNCLYQVRNIVGNKEIEKDFIDYYFRKDDNITSFNYEFIRGEMLQGKVVGGNIRCFLKLAGTEYLPDYKEKILFLESRSGDISRIYAFFHQLKSIGYLDGINGLILGQFTEIDYMGQRSMMIAMIEKLLDDCVPIVQTEEIGHSKDSKLLELNEYLELR